jgi:ribosomal protein S12 methylthiotransferase accessory factor
MTRPAEDGTATLERLETLVSPFGVVADARPMPVPRWCANMSFAAASFGHRLRPLGTAPASVPGDRRRAEQWGPNTAGYGRGLQADEARLTAIAEAAERYSAGDFQEGVRWAAYRDLDGPALDIQRIPRCSSRELSAAGCQLHPLDPDAPIRWIQGTDLISGAQTWVPAIMAYYGIRDIAPAERFWLGISTGYAVYSDPAEAVVRGIFEIIERDAIAVTWLQKLAPPLVAGQVLTTQTRALLEQCRQHFIDNYLLDMTTDIGVPTVLCLSHAPYDSQYAHAVGCATARTIEHAAEKSLIDACLSRPRIYSADPPPADFKDFMSITDGAKYMAARERSAAFGFLTTGVRDRETRVHQPLPEDPAGMLAWIVSSLAARGMQVIALDRTTSELGSAGLTAVSVIIPDLQPMSLHPLMQYRGHARLYSAPRLMGYPCYPEEELNPWPLPID